MSTVLTLIAHKDVYKAKPALKAFLETKNVVIDSETVVAPHVVDLFTAGSVTPFKDELDAFCAQNDCDVAVQAVNNRQKKLAVFDMDSTLIMNECIDLMAAKVGVEKEVAEITEAAMRGELDFSASLKRRVGLLKGVPVSIYDEVIAKVTLTNGAKELCAALRRNNVKLAVLSGGFQPIVDWIKQELNLDYAFANRLVDDGEVLTGETKGRIVDGQTKAALLQEIAAKESLEPKDAVAVGDGSNDLPMMGVAGFGVAWHAKPKVRKLAPSQLNSASLHDVLYILGYKE